MQKQIPIKNHQQEIRLITHRCLFASIAISLFILLLIEGIREASVEVAHNCIQLFIYLLFIIYFIVDRGH